jgi:aminoglycoside phosphotransferase family enzyme/predicted kinase
MGPGVPPTTPARVIETHISVLVFVGDRVYKLRKPVRFGFLDFTDRRVREADCRREVELNRRLAPDVYLGVADIEMDGEPIDHMVVMRALPDERRLATLVRAGSDVDGCLEQVATALATFHARARRSPAVSDAATEVALEATWEANFEETGRFVGTVLDPTTDRKIRTLAVRWLRRHTGLLRDRITSGHVCDGHGDLQAEDIFCLDDGVRILDCIEFTDRLRYGDVCADVAFLAMDLERLGRPDLAERFVYHYESRSGDRLPRALLHHCIAQRAYVRTKVACLRLEQGVAGSDGAARELHALALRHLRQARQALVLVGGLPGTGKSTLTAGLAAETGWAILRSDEVRGELQPPREDRGVEGPTSEPGAGRYAPDAVDAVYQELVRRARHHLNEGESVIVDASWIDAAHRAAAAQAVAETGNELIEFCCTCDDSVAAGRIERRRSRGDDASEATPRVRQAMTREMDAWPLATTINTSNRTPAECLSWALGELDTERQGAAEGP